MELPRAAFVGPLPVAAGDVARRMSDRVKRVEPGDNTGKARPDPHRFAHNTLPEQPRDLEASRREMEQRALPPGPPPAFEMTLLELERDLKHLLARIEAARAQGRDAEALKPAPQHDHADADAAQDSPPPPEAAEPTVSLAQTPEESGLIA